MTNDLLNQLTETIAFLEDYIANHKTPQLIPVLERLKNKLEVEKVKRKVIK